MVIHFFFVLLMMQEPYFTKEQSFSLGTWWKFMNSIGNLGYIRILDKVVKKTQSFYTFMASFFSGRIF